MEEGGRGGFKQTQSPKFQIFNKYSLSILLCPPIKKVSRLCSDFFFLFFQLAYEELISAEHESSG